MADEFTTNRLVAIVRNLKTIPSALLDLFFPMIVEEDSEEIHFDLEQGKRSIAPFVSPLVAGKLVQAQGQKVATFRPAYVKPKGQLQPDAPLKRVVGEAIGGNLTPMQRRELRVVQTINQFIGMITGRLVVMASEALRTGKVTVTGEGYPTVVVDFGRTATHTATLTGAARWGETGVSPVNDLEDWALLVADDSGAAVDRCVMDGKAWRFLKADSQFEKAVDLRRGGLSNAELGILARPGLEYRGMLGQMALYTYSGKYVNDAGSTVPIVPDYTVILGSAEVEGVRHFGAIQDERSGYQAMAYFPTTWLENDPPVRMVMVQSAPLVVPYRPDATLCRTVYS